MTIQPIKKEHTQFCVYGLMVLFSGLFHIMRSSERNFTVLGLASLPNRVNPHHLGVLSTLIVVSINFTKFIKLEKA